MTLTATRPQNVAELLHGLGGVPAERVRMWPWPGTATEDDVLAQNERKGEILCELVDGTLVEKTVGYMESTLAAWLCYLLHDFMAGRDLGEIAGPDGGLRLRAGLVRIPDVSFVRRSRFPGGQIPLRGYPALAPCLAVEILSPDNTDAEMALKRQEYFRAGTELVWQIDPRTREVEVFTAPEASTILREGDVLDGGTVLPGLSLPVARVFERLP